MAMSYLFVIRLLFLLSILHVCNSRLLRFVESWSFVSKIEPHYSMSRRIWMDQRERNFDNSDNDKFSYKEIIVGMEMLKGMKKHGSRLVMEFPMKEKVLNYDGNHEVGEDMVVMDYAQPHRKPPIHNEKP